MTYSHRVWNSVNVQLMLVVALHSYKQTSIFWRLFALSVLNSSRQMVWGQRLLVAPISTRPFSHTDSQMKIIFLASFEAECGLILTCSWGGRVLVYLPCLTFERNWTCAPLPLPLSADWDATMLVRANHGPAAMDWRQQSNKPKRTGLLVPLGLCVSPDSLGSDYSVSEK